MKLQIDFQNKNDLFLLLNAFEKYSHEVKVTQDSTLKLMGETNFIQALACLSVQLSGEHNESDSV